MKRGRAISIKMRTISEMHSEGVIDHYQKQALQELVRLAPPHTRCCHHNSLRTLFPPPSLVPVRCAHRRDRAPSRDTCISAPRARGRRRTEKAHSRKESSFGT